MGMMDAVVNCLAGNLRYHFYRNADDRCRYNSSSSLIGLASDIQWAIDDGKIESGYVLDTKTGKKISLAEADEIIRRIRK